MFIVKTLIVDLGILTWLSTTVFIALRKVEDVNLENHKMTMELCRSNWQLKIDRNEKYVIFHSSTLALSRVFSRIRRCDPLRLSIRKSSSLIPGGDERIIICIIYLFRYTVIKIHTKKWTHFFKGTVPWGPCPAPFLASVTLHVTMLYAEISSIMLQNHINYIDCQVTGCLPARLHYRVVVPLQRKAIDSLGALDIYVFHQALILHMINIFAGYLQICSILLIFANDRCDRLLSQ